MRQVRTVQLLGALLALTVVATACSRVPPGGELTYTFGAVSQDGQGGVAGTAGTGVTAGAGGSGASADTGTADTVDSGGTVGVVSADAGAASSGGTQNAGAASGMTGASGARDGGVARTVGGTPVTGVDGNTVKIVFHAKQEDCGDSAVQGANMNEEGRDMIRQFVGWFNDEVLHEYGWQLEHQIIDDGGALCPEKTRAAAQQIIREIQPFAALGLSVSAEHGPIMADLVSQAGIPHIGISFNTYEQLNQRKDYVFNAFITAQLAHEYLEAYIAKRVAGTQVEDAVTGLPEDRVYGMAMPDLPEYRNLAGILKQRLARHGVDVPHIYFISTDPGVGAQTALTTVNKMRNDGVNSLIFDFFPNGFLSGVALTQNMARQNYRPELLISTYGIPVIDQTNDVTVWERAHGTSPFSSLALRSAIVIKENGQAAFDERYQNVAENTEAYLDVWRERLGNNTDMSETSGISGANLFQFMSVLAVGLMGNPYDEVGGVLTREAFAEAVYETAQGEERRCGMWRLLGRDSPYHYHYNERADKLDGFHNRFTTVYWVNERTVATVGYYESYDNYRYFDGMADLPDEGLRDTGVEGVDNYYQEPIGLRPWVPCRELGMAE